jgi:hypothetical protein
MRPSAEKKMKPRMIDGLKVIEVEPGAPPPPEVPSWAERCELVEKPDLSPALKPWVIGAGAAGTIGCAVTLAFFSHWGMAPLPLSLAVLWWGLRKGASVTLNPSLTGRYLAFEANPEAGESEGSFAGRIAAGLFGAVVVAGAIGKLLSHERDWMEIGTGAAMGIFFLYHAISEGRSAGKGSDAGFILRFRALADPKRPLAADDSVTIAPPPAIPEPPRADEPSTSPHG